MNFTRLWPCSVFLTVLLASYASAGTGGTFVASGGSDSNPCSRNAPCRTIQAAINALPGGGTVVALDSAWYGSNLSITRSVSVTAPPGVFAGIMVSSGDGITIKLPSSVETGRDESVTLHGLTITSQVLGASGVVFTSGDQLEIEECVVDGFSISPNGRGVFFNGSGKLFVKDTIIRHNFVGIDISTTSGMAFAHMDNVSAVHNQTGIRMDPRTNAAVRNSTISGNSDTGIFVNGILGCSFNFGPDFGPALIDVEGCLVTNNGKGIAVDTAGISISNCTISHNQFGFFVVMGTCNTIGGGSIFSRGNNTITGNVANQGSLVPLNPQ